jgi:dihydrofolate reductase
MDEEKNQPKMIHVVAYQNKTRGIGYQNKLLYKFEKDMQHFKTTTLNHIVIMGRKTHDSIGRILPKRINIVLSRSPNSSITEDYFVFDTIPKALQWCREKHPEKKIFVIGGAEIYKATLPYVHDIIATEIDFVKEKTPLIDTYYPEIPMDFELVENKTELDIDKLTDTVYKLRFKKYTKQKNKKIYLFD